MRKHAKIYIAGHRGLVVLAGADAMKFRVSVSETQAKTKEEQKRIIFY